LSLHRLAGDILNTAGAFSNSKPDTSLSFKKAWAAFKNGAEQEVENRASFCAGCNPQRKNRNAAAFCGYNGNT
jgi:hypothetical protein